MTKELIEKIEDAHRRVRKIGPDAIYETELREVLRAAADALSARQPSEDDREALRKEFEFRIRTAIAHGCALGYRELSAQDRDEWVRGQVDRAVGSRAAVPDAATEELLKRVEEAEAQSAEDRVEWQQMKERASQRFNAYQQKKRELRQMEIRAEKAEAERAAALAAIERVRAAVSGHPECDRYEEGDVISCGWKSAYASVVAALDGAPELDPYDDFCPTCDAPNPWHTETCAVPFRPDNSALDGAPEPEWEYHLTEVETKREMTSPVYVLRGGAYLLDEHAGVLIDSAGNFSAKTKGNPRSLAVLLKAIAEAIEDDVELVPVKGESNGAQ